MLLLERFKKIEPINKGWSDDKKFYVETADGRRMFLRISDISEHDRKKSDYEMMKQAYELGIRTPQPFEFGLCEGGKNVYSLSEWIDGKGADIVLPLMSEAEQYALGVMTGEVLRKIHSMPAPKNIEPWSIRFRRKVQYWADENKSPMLINYLETNRNILDSRPQTFIHGDYNIENIIVMPDGEICVIDFNSYNTQYGDPWWDLNNMAWMPASYSYFQTGQINGYFNGPPPTVFWNVFTYYLAYDALAASTDPYGINGIEDGTEIVNNILNWTSNFQKTVPNWYLK
ncbi:MAG: phosphotransferase [Oscillospiraceae bacterium]|nr:phosphotransferase [Oscillospiraceae bacterium]